MKMKQSVIVTNKLVLLILPMIVDSPPLQPHTMFVSGDYC